LALPVALIAFGLFSSALDAENLELGACERFAEHYIHTNGHIDRSSRRQCNARPQYKCDAI
jgi:hypothetical protein